MKLNGPDPEALGLLTSAQLREWRIWLRTYVGIFGGALKAADAEHRRRARRKAKAK